MVEPFSLAAGQGLAITRESLKKRWAADETAAYEKALRKRLRKLPGFPDEPLTHLLSLPQVQARLLHFIDVADLDEEALRRDVEEACSGFSEVQARPAFADEVIAAVLRGAGDAASSDRRAMSHHAERHLAATREGVEEIVSVVERVATSVSRSPSAVVRTLLATSEDGGFGVEITAILRDLAAVDESDVALLIEHLGGNLSRAESLAVDPPAWTEGRTAEFWSAVGRILALILRPASSEKAFLIAEQTLGADRVAMLASAASRAEADGRADDAERHLVRARAMDAAHTALKLHDIALKEDIDVRIVARAGLSFTTNKDRIALLLSQIDDLAELGRRAEITACVNEILQLDPHNLFGLDRRLALLHIEQRARAAESLVLDRVALVAGVNESLDLRRRLARYGRARETGGVLIRAVDMAAMAGDLDWVRRLIDDEATTQELSAGDVRLGLAAAALHVGLHDEAVALLGDEAGWGRDEHELSVQIALGREGPGSLVEAHRRGSELLAEHPTSLAAALVVAVASSEEAELPWSEDAYALLREVDPAQAAVLKGDRLALEGDLLAAEALLAPFSHRAQVLRTLVRHALADEQWRRALGLADRLCAQTGRAEDRLLRAGAIRGLGQTPRLVAELEALVNDDEAAPEVRARACGLLTGLLPPTDPARLAHVSQRWIEADPTARAPLWNLAYTLSIRGLHTAALKTLDDARVPVTNLDEARRRSKTLFHAAPPLLAAEEIGALADRFDHEDAEMEGMILALLLGADLEHRPDLDARREEAMKAFDERFADAGLFRSIPFDEIEDLIALIDEDLERSEGVRRRVLEQIQTGRAPLALLADATGRSLPRLVAAEVLLPMASGDVREAELDRQAARDAVGAGALWDPVAIAVAAMLPGEIRQVVVSQLPTSAVAASTVLAFANASVDNPLSDPGTKSSFVRAGGRTKVVDHDPAAEARQAQIVEVGTAMVGRLPAIADVDIAVPDRLDQHLGADSDPQSALRGCLATASAARRTDRALYSDDRVIRAIARNEGTTAFSTAALLEVLAERHLLTPEQAAAGRACLLGRGASGLNPEPDELVQAARDSGWELDRPWIMLVYDRQSLVDPERHLKGLKVLLREIDRDAPAELDLLAAHALNAFRAGTLGVDLEDVAAALIVGSWVYSMDLDQEEVRYSVRLYRALEAAPKRLVARHHPDLVGACFLQVLLFMTTRPRNEHGVAVKIAIRHLPWRQGADLLMRALSRPRGS